MKHRNSIIYILLFFAAFVLVYCNQPSNQVKNTSLYLNLQDSVDYIGMETCRSCHANVYHTFIETGMGQSFDKATREKSGADFGSHAIVYDEKSDFYYKPFFENDTMYVMEFRLSGKDTIHKRIEQIDYIVGSGHHTNSHIIEENGYIFQAPITYYTQEGRWDMAPGFEEKNQRFSRFLSTECITCHNHFPKAIEGSLNKYDDMPSGIECERCHGPGEIHVREKLAGNIVDTSKFIDYTIVNPVDLSKDLQMDLCQRCHLQGIPVLEPGKTFFDFKPGMELSEVMNVFLPRYTNSDERFIMASQADRLRLSKCYTMSEELTCLSCHHPHHSVQTVDKSNFNKVCVDCHQQKKLAECAAPMNERNAVGDNCVSCHMPPSSSIDIPHIRITDHYISRITDFEERQISEPQKKDIAQFLGLKMLTKEKAEDLEMANGYLAMFDKLSEDQIILDSAYYFLNKSTASKSEKFVSWIHYYFSSQDYKAITELAKENPASVISDAWTAYRIGEAFYNLNKLSQSLLYFKKSTQLNKYNLEFQEKLGVNYLSQGSIPQAKMTFEFVLQENRKRPLALTNLGFVYINLNEFEKGESLYDEALSLNPDYVQALINKAAIRNYFEDKKTSILLLNKVLKLEPQNKTALELLKQIELENN